MITFQRHVSSEHGTPGIWYREGLKYCHTLEPEHPPLIAGLYLLQWYFSPKHNYHVPRYISLSDSTIKERYFEVHPGNIYVDTDGCTLPGTGFGMFNCAITWPNDPIKSKLGVIPGVLNSREMFDRITSEIYLGKIKQNDDGTENYFGGTEIQIFD